MELWIRTQTKTGLFKVDSVYYAGMDKNKYIIYYKDIRLGIYKNEERALEVLDEIQNIIRGKYAISLDMEAALSKGISQKEAEKMLMQIAVYEMPEN